MSQIEGWQLSGRAAEFYEQYVTQLMAPWVQSLIEVAALRPGERVVDVACGTGFVARLAADLVGVEGQVVGVDLNASMIEAARAASDVDGKRHIDWRVGDVAALPLDEAAFDVVLCQQGVQFFPDRVGALKEMRRVLRPGGRLAFTVWSAIADTPYFGAVAFALAKHVSPDVGATVHIPCALHDARELRDLVTSAGFGNVQVRPTIKETRLPSSADAVLGRLAATPIAQLVAQMTVDGRAALVGEITGALTQYVDGEQWTVPAGVHVVTAEA